VTHLSGATLSWFPLAPVVVLPGAVAGSLVGWWWCRIETRRAGSFKPEPSAATVSSGVSVGELAAAIVADAKTER
jgi:hypothetical protein